VPRFAGEFGIVLDTRATVVLNFAFIKHFVISMKFLHSISRPGSVRIAVALATAVLCFLPVIAGAAEEGAPAKKIDDRINEAMKPATEFINSVVFYSIKINDEISMPLVIIWLAAAAIFCTFYFKFINLRSWGLTIRTIRGKYSSPSDPGEITHFQALTAALSGTVGLGNIAGVATAISIGGPGATFWMIVMGFLGMTTKFAECTLGVRYRDIDARGKVFGGPMQYLKKGLAERGLKEVGMVMAVFFAFMCIGGSFGGGNMYQINSATTQFVNTFCDKGGFWDNNRWVFGLIIAVIVGAVIIGGIKSIGKVTAKLVPLMCGMYVVAALMVLLTHLPQIPGAIGEIFSGAFANTAVVGGLVGVLIQGMKRATFSNEAGVGSAAIAHSAVMTRKPASEGIVALLEPFVDTVVVCTMTALAIVVTGTYKEAGVEGIQITSDAFATVLPWFPYILSLAVILFAFSTMISWSYYGQQAWAYLFGRSKGVELSYNLLFCAAIVVGAALTLGQVTDFSDAMIFAMCVPNLIGVYILLPVIKGELKDFRDHSDRIDRGE
jgi:AGCS family alanine or glycine:cation symporter